MISLKAAGLAAGFLVFLMVLAGIGLSGVAIQRIRSEPQEAKIDFSRDIFIHMDSDGDGTLTISDYRVFYYQGKTCKLTQGAGNLAFSASGFCHHSGDAVYVEANKMGLAENKTFILELMDGGECMERRSIRTCTWNYL